MISSLTTTSYLQCTSVTFIVLYIPILYCTVYISYQIWENPQEGEGSTVNSSTELYSCFLYSGVQYVLNCTLVFCTVVYIINWTVLLYSVLWCTIFSDLYSCIMYWGVHYVLAFIVLYCTRVYCTHVYFSVLYLSIPYCKLLWL